MPIDLAAATAAMTSLKSAFDLTKAISDVVGTAKVRDQIIELQSQILSAQQSAMIAQQAQSSLVGRVSELEAEIARLKKWDADKSDYRFEDVGQGVFVYSPKSAPTEAEPNHWLCVKCFDAGNRSILQKTQRDSSGSNAVWVCASCPTKFSLHYSLGPHRREASA